MNSSIPLVTVVALVALVAVLAIIAHTNPSSKDSSALAVPIFDSEGNEIGYDMYMHLPPGSGNNRAGAATTSTNERDYYPYWRSNAVNSEEQKQSSARDSVWNFH